MVKAESKAGESRTVESRAKLDGPQQAAEQANAAVQRDIKRQGTKQGEASGKRDQNLVSSFTSPKNEQAKSHSFPKQMTKEGNPQSHSNSGREEAIAEVTEEQDNVQTTQFEAEPKQLKKYISSENLQNVEMNEEEILNHEKLSDIPAAEEGFEAEEQLQPDDYNPENDDQEMLRESKRSSNL